MKKIKNIGTFITFENAKPLPGSAEEFEQHIEGVIAPFMGDFLTKELLLGLRSTVMDFLMSCRSDGLLKGFPNAVVRCGLFHPAPWVAEKEAWDKAIAILAEYKNEGGGSGPVEIYDREEYAQYEVIVGDDTTNHQFPYIPGGYMEADEAKVLLIPGMDGVRLNSFTEMWGTPNPAWRKEYLGIPG